MGKETLNKKIYKLREYFIELEPYMTLEIQEIINNREKNLSIERLFQLLVDEAIDVNSAILYSMAKKASDSYKSSFFDLASIGVIDYEFASKIAGSAGLRNNIVHDYDKLQKKDVLLDIMKFLKLYKEYIKLLIEKFVVTKS